MLEDYRVKCENEGNYVEAKKARQKYEELRKKETLRQLNLMRIKQQESLRMVDEAQQKQLEEFSKSWDSYLAEYEATAYQSLQKLKEKHLQEYQEFRQKALDDAKKKVKHSKELLELRQKEQKLVKQRQYEEAQVVRGKADELEAWENAKNEAKIQKIISKNEKLLRKQQEQALAVLLKRIQRDRMEQLKHREVDSQKLAMRNRNIRNNIINKQNDEAKRAVDKLKKGLKASNEFKSTMS